MEKSKDLKNQELRGNISLENRKKLTLTGVQEVLSFDDEKISLNTNLGSLMIKGSELKMNKLDVKNGDVIIIGNVASMIYSGKEVRREKESIIKRLFR